MYRFWQLIVCVGRKPPKRVPLAGLGMKSAKLSAQQKKNRVTAWNARSKRVKHYLYHQTMRRTIIFIPKGQAEPVTVVVNHKPELNDTEHAGVWNIDTNEVFLSTPLWNQFPVNDQKQQGKVFAGLHKVSSTLIK